MVILLETNQLRTMEPNPPVNATQEISWIITTLAVNMAVSTTITPFIWCVKGGSCLHAGVS